MASKPLPGIGRIPIGDPRVRREVASLIRLFGSGLIANGTTGQIEVNNSALSLAGLGDVSVAGATNGQVLTYNSTTHKWNATTISLAGYAQYLFGANNFSGTGNFTGGSIAGTSLTDSGLTAGGVIFAGTGGLLAQAATYFTWDATNNVMGVGGASSTAAQLSLSSHDNSTLHLKMPPITGLGWSGVLGRVIQPSAGPGMIFTVAMGGADSLLCFYGGASLYNLGVFSSGPWSVDGNSNSGNYYNTYQPLGLGYVVLSTSLETIPAYFSIKNKMFFGVASINPGTVSTSGSTVTGVGTQFAKSFQVGDSIHIPITGHVSKTILTITDDAHLTTSGSAWATQTGVNYYGSQQLYFAAGGLTGMIAAGDQVGIEGTWAVVGVTPYFTAAAVVSDTVLRLTTATPSTLYNTSVGVDFVNGVNPDAFQVVPNATQPAQHGLNTIGPPTAQLDIGPSTGAPGSASIKLEPGVVLATKEDGALEYDGTHLYFTIGATRHTIV